MSPITRINPSKNLLLRVLLRLGISRITTFLLARSLLQLLILTLNELVLHRSLIFPAHSPVLIEITDTKLNVLFLLAEAVGRGNLVIKIDLLFVEDEDVAAGDHITSWVDEVATSIDHAAEFVIQLAIRSLQNNRISCLVRLEFAEDLINGEVGELGLAPLGQLLALALRSLWLRLLLTAVVLGVRVGATAITKRIVSAIKALVVIYAVPDIIDEEGCLSWVIIEINA